MMENITFFLLIPLIVLLFFLIVPLAFRSKRRQKTPPGPRGLPLIGNFHQLKKPLHLYFSQLKKEYGPLLYLKLGSRGVLVANSSKTAEQILKTQDLIFCSRPAMLALRKLSYDGLDIVFSPYSENWREMRKVCVLHLLSAKRVQSYRHIREEEVSRMLGKINQQILSSEAINLSNAVADLTSNIICRVGFGKRYEQGTGESREFEILRHEFHQAISDFYFADYFPWMGWIDKLITGKIDNLDRIFKRWDSFYQQLIDEHLQPNRSKSTEGGDVIDILLELGENGSEESFNLPNDHIKAVLMNLYFASTDTTTTTTVWAMTALMKNPTALKKAQMEIRNLLSTREKQIVEEDDIVASGLPYLNAVIKEALRMHTTVPLLAPRETMEKCTIDGHEIPAKTLVHVNAWGIGNDPELWENPEKFMPERFLRDERRLSMDMKGQDFEFIPFGAGRRGCPGVNMALATMQIVLANLLYSYDWDMPDGLTNEDVDTEILDGIASHKKIPLRLNATKYA